MTIKSNENLRALLERSAAQNGEKDFLFSEADRRKWTYSEFDKPVNRAANMLTPRLDSGKSSKIIKLRLSVR